MHSYAIKSLVTCALGAVVMAGCASSPSSPATASAQGNLQSGKVATVENAAVTSQSAAASSSGGGAAGMTASGEPTVITVVFADGSQGRYSIDQPAHAFAVGQPVNVITYGERITIASPSK